MESCSRMKDVNWRLAQGEDEVQKICIILILGDRLQSICVNLMGFREVITS